MGDAKSVSKRMKEAGLKQLRLYCEMCKKQCRDENGYKLHCLTPGHLANMELFSANSKQMVERFSEQFEKAFMDVLVHGQGRTMRVYANSVYQEVIADKHHVHMNATKWNSLAAFVMHLGATGKCHVDQDERGGWWIRWIDPQARAREVARREREQRDADTHQRREDRIMRQVAAAAAAAAEAAPSSSEAVHGIETEHVGPVRLQLATTRTGAPPLLGSSGADPRIASKAFGEEDAIMALPPQLETPKASSSSSSASETADWMAAHPGIVIKILSGKVAGKAVKRQKAVVLESHPPGTTSAKVCLLSTGQELPSIPEHVCETVIPGPGRKVQFVSGRRKGQFATVRDVLERGVLVGLGDGTVEMEGFDAVCRVFE